VAESSKEGYGSKQIVFSMMMMIMVMTYFMPCIIVPYDQPIFMQSFRHMLIVSLVLICLSCHDLVLVRLSQLRLHYWMHCHEIWYEYHKTKIHPPSHILIS
jgi:hypothetical protein